MHLSWPEADMNSSKTETLVQCEEVSQKTRFWKPFTLRPPFLILILIITGALIAVLQWLLDRSETEGGLIFASNVHQLPLSKTFSYLYAPTIIAVVYSLIWNWIDLDVKRLEPFFQLCNSEGALAEHSLLLHYPSDFIALAPCKAFRRRHWSVVCAGVSAVLVSWTLTPLQAGIFATEQRVTKTTVPFLTSTSYVPVSQQDQLSALYAQHAYNIAWLQEALPAYMTKDAILSPFRPDESLESKDNEVWNGTTQMYSVDVTCERPVIYNNTYALMYNSSYGCSYEAPPIRTLENNDTSKYLEALYVGYQDENGMADYYLSSNCPSTASHTFLVRMAKASNDTILDMASANDDTDILSATSLYCQPRYYVQTVNASVAAVNGTVLSITATGTKKDLPSDLFDTDRFEWAMNSAQDENYSARGDFPTTEWPDQKTHFINTHLDMAYLPKMVPFSFACLQRPSLEDYLDGEVLREAYQAAYRLLFVRQMTTVLKSDFGSSAAQHIGQRTYQTQAIVLVPGFVYAVEGLLGIVMILTASILYLACTRRCHLQSDPSTMAYIMSMTSDDTNLLAAFSGFDKCSSEDIASQLRGSSFRMTADGRLEIREIELEPSTNIGLPKNGQVVASQSHLTHGAGIQPTELRWWSGVLFFIVQFACVLILVCLWYLARTNNGLPLPSTNRFVRQLVENYIPTAIATFLEPFWTLLNRLLCLLQPFEELRRGKANSSRSIDLDYNSLPPQLVAFKAFRARHYVLAAVCTMSILSNVLSVAFSGLFFEDSVSHEVKVNFQPLLSLPFTRLNGTAAPFNSNTTDNWQGGTTKDEFYIAMSNTAASSKLPPWTDANRFYFPVGLPQDTESTNNFTFTTQTFEADLQCQDLAESNVTLFSKDGTFDIRVPSDNGTTTKCQVLLTMSAEDMLSELTSMSGSSAFELSLVPMSSEFCRQHVVAGWWRGNVSEGTISSLTGTVLLCRPQLLIGTAEIVVDHNGYILQSSLLNVSDGSIAEYFTTEPKDLIVQAHQFIIDNGDTWHNDSFPSDWLNYLITKTTLSNRLLDANLPAPGFAEAVPPFVATYNKLFAILLGHNKDILFTKPQAVAVSVTGSRIQSETRIFLSPPAFVISGVILCLYIITTVFLYTRRPWRILHRLPTSFASIAAFFAASFAIKDFRGTSEMSRSERSRWLRELDHRWAFGTFMGTDRRVHVGVEREPFVNTLREEMIPVIKTAREEDTRQKEKARSWAVWRS